MTQFPHPLLIIGGGNMAQAIVRGGLDAGFLSPDRLHIVDPDPARRNTFEDWSIATSEPGDAGLRWIADTETETARAQVLLAIKPQALAEAAPSLSSLFSDTRRVAISILAGTPSRSIRKALGEHAAVVRAMPNTPTLARAGITAIALGDNAQPGDEEPAVALFGAVGRVLRLEEDMFNAYTAVAGSGPAYVFLLAEAMIRAGTELGLSEHDATEAAIQAIAGAGVLLKNADQTPEALRQSVTSKGGITAAAISTLERGSFQRLVGEALGAACGRGEELADEIDEALAARTDA